MNSGNDDILQSCDSYDNARNIIMDAERSLAVGGFNMKGWIVSGISNDISPLSEEIRLVNGESEKVLGMMWNPKKAISHIRQE